MGRVDGGYAVDLGDVPIPDLTNPDPLVAVGELYRFNSWLLEHAASPEWAEVIAMRPGHAYVDLRLVHEAFRFKRLDYTGDQVFHAAGLEVIGEPDGVGGVPRDVAAGAPPGSVAVSYETSTGPYRSVGSDGVVYQEFPRFDLVITVVLSPTESGWKIFWEER